MDNIFNCFICRYHEIAVKGGNRLMFEKRLMENMGMLLERAGLGVPADIRRSRGRIMIHRKDNGFFSSAETETVKKALADAFGLESFSPAVICGSNMDSVTDAFLKSSSRLFSADRVRPGGQLSFRIRARRSDKNFPLNSKQIELRLAETAGTVYGSLPLKVNLGEDADITVGCEVREKFSFVYYESFRGPGGLPVGSNAPVLALVSGGIDSPVACRMIFKRGCPVGFVTFHSAPYTPPESVDKVRRLVDMLNRTQVPRPLYVCNIADFQKQVRDLCSESRRTVLYRRAMLRIAWIIAQRERYGALATGESLGQVASQTLSNMAAINSAVDGALVLRPLLGLDKLEIIEMARKMGTFDISKEDVPDSCVVFAPASPATSSIVAKLEAEERKIPDYQGMLERAAAEAAVYWPGHQRNNL